MGTATVFRTPEEAALDLELPLLGVVPPPQDQPGPFAPSVPGAAEKAYRQAVERMLRPAAAKRMVGILGDVDASRRAQVAGALATIAAGDRGAVLVDADLRAAHLSFDPGSRAQEGLVDVLRYGVRSPRVVAPTSTPGLDLLPVGSATVDLFGTYGSDAAAPLFEELARSGSAVVVNGPGPGDMEAAAPLLRRVPGWVLVVETGRSDVEVTRRLRDSVGAARCAGLLVVTPERAAATTEPAATAPSSAATPAPARPPARAATPAPAEAPARPAATPTPPARASAPPPASEPDRPAPPRRTSSVSQSVPPLSPSAPPTPPPLAPVAVRPVKVRKPEPAKAPVAHEEESEIGGGSRRMIFWSIGVAAVAVIIAVVMLRPHGGTDRPKPTPARRQPAAVATAPVPTPPVATESAPPSLAEETGGTEATGTAMESTSPEEASLPGGSVEPAPTTGSASPAAENAAPAETAAPVEQAAAPSGQPAAPVETSAPAPARTTPTAQPPAATQTTPAPHPPAAATQSPPKEESPPARRETTPALTDFRARAVPLVAGQNVWAVHTSSFRTEASAREEAARFNAAGFPTVFQWVDIPDKGRWIRIYVGPFGDRATAEDAAARIRAGIQDYTMVRRLPAGELEDGTGREDR